jgi:hypothetical protein
VVWAAVRTKGSFFQALFQRLVPRLGMQKALWAVAHRLSHVLWIVLHRKERYSELGPITLNPRSIPSRLRKMIRHLTSLGYAVAAPSTT